MSLDDFTRICGAPQPPETLAGPLLALYWDARGNWKRAHEVAQGISGADGSLVHAYLHRKEGDIGNAHYWYDRAGRQPPAGTLEQEWRAIAAELCGQG